MAEPYVCPECGLDYDTISPSDAVVAVRSFPRRYREEMADYDDEALARRPAPKTWSAIEYTAHVADLFDSFAEMFRRLRADLGADFDGLFWDQDERAAEQNYGSRSKDDVLGALESSAKELADEIDKYEPSQWSAEVEFPWGKRDLLTMARNGVHEGSHHLRDVRKVLSGKA